MRWEDEVGVNGDEALKSGGDAVEGKAISLCHMITCRQGFELAAQPSQSKPPSPPSPHFLFLQHTTTYHNKYNPLSLSYDPNTLNTEQGSGKSINQQYIYDASQS